MAKIISLVDHGPKIKGPTFHQHQEEGDVMANKSELAKLYDAAELFAKIYTAVMQEGLEDENGLMLTIGINLGLTDEFRLFIELNSAGSFLTFKECLEYTVCRTNLSELELDPLS